MNKETFNFLKNIPAQSKDELFETIIKNDKVKIERIISYSHTTPKDFWYDQEEDEFVVVLEGKAIITYDDMSSYTLEDGDSLYIPAHQKHQVTFTSNPTIWLAIFI